MRTATSFDAELASCGFRAGCLDQPWPTASITNSHRHCLGCGKAHDAIDSDETGALFASDVVNEGFGIFCKGCAE